MIWILLGKNQRRCQSMCCPWAVSKSPAAATTHPARAASLPPGNEQAMNRQGKELQRAQIWFHSRKILSCSTGKAGGKNKPVPKALKLLTSLAICQQVNLYSRPYFDKDNLPMGNSILWTRLDEMLH